MSRAASLAPGVAEGYARLRPGGGGAAVAGRCALVWVEGPEAAAFLHGLLSNDVAGLGPGEWRRALLLDAKGHVQADMRVHRDGADAFTLVVDPALGATVAALLDRYHFSEDLELLGPEEAGRVTVTGGAGGGGADLVVGGILPGSRDLVVDDAAAAIAALGVPEAPAEALEAARVAAGAPRVGVDTGPTTLVQEAGLEADAVSFDKGCYLGQETVARVQHRGRVNRRLRGLRARGPEPPAPGAAVLREGREVGRVSSAAATPDLGAIALAILRREVAEGDPVEVERLPGGAVVADLPFESP